MSNAFAPIVRARPNPIFGRPVHQGSPPIDYSPILLRKPFRFRLAPDTLSSAENLGGQPGITPAFGYSAPHPSAGGTLPLLIHALPSAHYVSAALITDAGTDREGWRLAAREIEEAVIRILADALTSPAGLVERVGAAGITRDQVRKLLSRAARMAAALGGSPGERAKLVRELVEKIIVDEKTIIIKLRRGFLLGEDVASSAGEAASNSAVELTATAAFTRRGAETKLVLPGLAPQKHSSRCDPALIKAIARGRA